MKSPRNLIDEIEICIKKYLEVHHKLPKYAVLNDECFLELCNRSNPMVVPAEKYPDKKYLLHEEGGGRIEILTQKDLQEKERSELTEKTRDMGLALVLSKSKRIKNAVFYDIALPHEKLLEELENSAQ